MKLIKALIREYSQLDHRVLLENLAPKGKEKEPPWILMGEVGGNPAFVIGPGAKKFLESKGFRPDQIDIVFNKFHNVPISRYRKYDDAFKMTGSTYNISNDTLKAMAVEESELGNILIHPNWPKSTASGVIHMTKSAVEELNKKRVAKGQDLIKHADLQNQSYARSAIDHAAQYMKDVLMPLYGETPADWLPHYKTGPDSDAYLTRVTALKKFILLFDKYAIPNNF